MQNKKMFEWFTSVMTYLDKGGKNNIIIFVCSISAIILNIAKSHVAGILVFLFSIVSALLGFFQYIFGKPFSMIINKGDWIKENNEYVLSIPKTLHNKEQPKVTFYSNIGNNSWCETLMSPEINNGDVVVKVPLGINMNKPFKIDIN